MSTQQGVSGRWRGRKPVRAYILPLLILGLVVAMALSTRVVRIGSEQDPRVESFSSEAFGRAEFPGIQGWVMTNAVEAETLVEALNDDDVAAVEQYGTPSGIAPLFPVTFTGELGEGQSGIHEIDVASLPDDLTVRVQLGTAINGTDLRDVTGTIDFGQFTNQIEYQNAGQALNDEMKATVLEPRRDALVAGETVRITGAFRLLNPQGWLVTPVNVEVL